MTPETIELLLVLLPVAVIALILPWLGHTRPGILFGVTVPLDFPGSPEARRDLRSYRLGGAVLSIVILSAAALVVRLTPHNSLAVTITPIAAVLAELAGNLLLWRSHAARIKFHAILVPIERHADLNPGSSAGPIFAAACAMLPLAVTALWLRLHWSEIPARWASHWNASGVADGWATRSVMGVYFPLMNGAVFVLLLCGMLLFMACASGPEVTQRRRALVPLAALAWLITGMFCIIGLIPLVHLTTSQFISVIATYLVLVAAVTFWLLRRGGLTLNAPSVEPYDSTPDARWHAGIFYYNPADAAVIVPKRFGFGWTLNFARTAAWIYIGGLVGILTVIVVLSRRIH
jgi:uncharacterized membrane protein